MKIHTTSEVDKMSHAELKEYDRFLHSIVTEIFTKKNEIEKSIPMPKSLQDIGGGSHLTQQERNDFKAEYIKKKAERQEEIERQVKKVSDEVYSRYGTTKDHVDYVREKYNESYRNIPNSEKYKADILLLEEAKRSAISVPHKDKIQRAITRIETTGNDYRDDEFAKIWYMGAKQFVSNIITKLGGTRYHKSSKDVTGSVYYNLPNDDSIRISDHELPDTEQRRANREAGIGGKWIEIVLDNAKPFSELKEQVLETLNDGIGYGELKDTFKKQTEELKEAIGRMMAQKEFGGVVNEPNYRLKKSILCNYEPTQKGVTCSNKTLNSIARCHHHIEK